LYGECNLLFDKYIRTTKWCYMWYLTTSGGDAEASLVLACGFEERTRRVKLE
jgi:hypothetical protein